MVKALAGVLVLPLTETEFPKKDETPMNTSRRKIVRRRLLSPLAVVFVLVLSHPVGTGAGELHTSVLGKDVTDSFTCSASNIGDSTRDVEIAIISGGVPTEEMLRLTLTIAAGDTRGIGTSPSNPNQAARCSMFFSGPDRNIRGVLTTGNTRERAEAR
jgi:hypothetical protein